MAKTKQPLRERALEAYTQAQLDTEDFRLYRRDIRERALGSRIALLITKVLGLDAKEALALSVKVMDDPRRHVMDNELVAVVEIEGMTFLATEGFPAQLYYVRTDTWQRFPIDNIANLGFLVAKP